MPSVTGSSVAGHDRQRLLPPSLEARLIGTLGRGCGLALLLTLAAVWASMVSWSVADPSLTHATDGPVSNALGAPGAILADLLPRNVTIQIFKGLLENAASEQGASMTAMDNATRNAGELINKLTIVYNRTRQAAITTELIEIIAGAEAL